MAELTPEEFSRQQAEIGAARILAGEAGNNTVPCCEAAAARCRERAARASKPYLAESWHISANAWTARAAVIRRAEAALTALENGVWDHPDLMAVGPLHVEGDKQRQQIIDFYSRPGANT